MVRLLRCLAVLAIAAFQLRCSGSPSPVAPWSGALPFTDASLGTLLEPDLPLRSSSFFETKDKEAMYVAELRDAPPRDYERHYLELLRSRGVFVRGSGGSAHAPRPVDAYQFIVLEKGPASEHGLSLRYREFRDRKPEPPAGTPWWHIENWRPYPSPVQRRGNSIWVRLGNARHAIRGEIWPLPERDEIEGPELPVPRFPGAVVRDWGPGSEDERLVESPGLHYVRRLYVVRGATREMVVAHYERALREFGVTPAPETADQHGVEWWGKEPVKGVERIAVAVHDPGLVWGRPLDRRGEAGVPEQLFPWLKELVQIEVDVLLPRLDDAVVLWSDADRRRRELLLAARDGTPAPPAAPAPIAPKVAILKWGLFGVAHQFFHETLHEAVRLVEPQRVSVGLLAEHRVLVIPTGGLDWLGARADFVTGLAQFVGGGGVVVAFAQAKGSDYAALPVPSGERLRALGYETDRSTYTQGVRVEQGHPMLASLAEGVATINVDGGFEEVPASARVLLRKATSDLAALVVYRVGHGWVIASSIFDDCLSCERPGPGRPDVVRDMLAWARDPVELPWHAPGAGVVLSVPVANRALRPAAAVVLRLLNPARDRLMAETTVRKVTAPRRDDSVRWALRLPEDAPRGIHHLTYTLLDADGRVVQPAVESPTARVVVGVQAPR